MYKTTTIIMVVLAMLFTGCAGMQIATDDNEQFKLLAIRIASRELAKKLCEEGYCTEKYTAILAVTDQLLTEARKGNTQVINLGKAYLLTLVEDGDLAQDISDLFDLMELSPDPNDVIALDDPNVQAYLTRFAYAVEGFQQGVKKKE